MTRVAVVVPTLDEESRLDRCLASIRRQDYPQNKVSILVADGGSRDATLDIARRHGCEIVDAAGLLAEAAKTKALARVDADVVAMIDADNTIVGDHWLPRAVDALLAHPDALGFESYYSLRPEDPALNRYLTGLLQISDPWARAVAMPLRRLEISKRGVEVFALPTNGGYPTGANGFLFRRHELEQLGDAPFHEAAFFPELMRTRQRTLLKRPDCQVHHDYV
ncbi:MAG: glycosyltransferase family A protein, partial [Acidobacteriota bacterium]